MIFSNSTVEASDNSGAKKIKIINVNGNSRYATLGSNLTIVLRKGNIWKGLFKKTKYKGIVSCLKRDQRRLDGTVLLLDTNKIFLFDRDRHKFLGTRGYGFLSKELRYKKKDFQYKRIFSTVELIV